ncbi:MAG: secondary thiamine-phosphate synthase enzyme YjbQ, partial [Candidatus Syntropharchaeia archaeon]
ITDKVRICLEGIRSGICTVYTPHTTTAIVINENESGLRSDIFALLDKLVPGDGSYRHNRIDNNAHAHLRSLLLGPGVVIPVEDGDLMLGTWQRIFFVELDGPRRRRVYVKVIEG